MLVTMVNPGMTSTFSEEMIAWYADRESHPMVGPEDEDDDDANQADEAGKQATLVWTILVPRANSVCWNCELEWTSQINHLSLLIR